MEKYKKKSLKFSGYSRDLRNIERNNTRSMLRFQRFSVSRPLNDEDVEEKKQNDRNMPSLVKPKAQASSRLELLQKWKQEKTVKKQQESKLKKPVFKVGAAKSNPSPICQKPLFGLDSSKGLYKSSFQMSSSQLFGKKQESYIASNSKTSIKVFNSQVSTKKKDIPLTKVATNAKVSNSQLSVKKTEIATANLKPSVKGQLSGGGKQPVTSTKSLETKKESRLQPPCIRSTIPKGVKSNIPSSGLPKPTTSKSIKAPEKRIPAKSTIVPLQKGSSKLLNVKPTFECELSHIEPVKERKSFAPAGFKFQPPVELSSSLFSEDGPSAIFMRYRNQFIRTSTPKAKAPAEDLEFVANEESKCLNNENIKEKNIEQKSLSESSEKHDFETQLSSSPGSVFLNEEKPTDCKQSLKFECLEVLKPNEEDVILSSKSISPEHQLAKEPSLAEADNSSFLPNIVEVHKTEIDLFNISPAPSVPFVSHFTDSGSAAMATPVSPFTDIGSAASAPSVSPSTDIGSAASAPSVSPSTGIGSMASAPSVNCSTDTGYVASAISDSRSTNTGSDGHSETTVNFSNNDSVFSEDKELLGKKSDKDLFTLNGFFHTQEHGHLKVPIRNRNFRRSEKPGLTSINESVENTPKSAFKKKVLDGDFTPRRSLRLAKLSGQFSSLENLLDSPKTKNKDKSVPKENFAARRSSRLSKFSTEFNSDENLFDVRRITFYGSPEEGQAVQKLHSKVTYDFDRLSLETEEETSSRTTRSGKVSLLYTPPNKSRPSAMRRSIKEDLMSFSPNF